MLCERAPTPLVLVRDTR